MDRNTDAGRDDRDGNHVAPLAGAWIETLVERLLDGTSGLLHNIVKTGNLSQTFLHLDLAPNILAAELEVASEELAIEAATFTVPVALRRRGVETKLVIGSSTNAPDPVLIRALANAHRWALALREGTPLKTVAQEAGHHGAYSGPEASSPFCLQRSNARSAMAYSLSI